MREFDVDTPDGHRLHGYDTGPIGPAGGPVVLYHAGTPNIGAPPEPLFPVSDRLGIRWIGYDRPGYGGSPRQDAASISDAAVHARLLGDHLGVERFAVFGHSGGGPRALACAAMLTDRVLAAVAVSSPAPWGAEGLDYFAGMNAGSIRELRAAVEGPEALAAVVAAGVFEPDAFTSDDYAELDTTWSWFDGIVASAIADGFDGFVDDDIAMVSPWGFSPADIAVPTRLVHGTADRMVPLAHSTWLNEDVAAAELVPVHGAGHISVLRAAPDALAWLTAAAAR